MAGYILYNGFWNREPPDPARRLAQAGERLGTPLCPLPNTAFVTEFTGTPDMPHIRVTAPSGPLTERDFVLCWDKDVRLLRAMEACGTRVYNPAASVALCDDKAATHRVLGEAGLPMPRTFVAPMTYVSYDEPGDAFLQTAAASLGFPLVVKECFGSLGEQVYLARDAGELFALARKMGPRPFLLQEYVRPAGEDYRLYVVGDRVVAAMHRRAQNDFRANIGAGGSGESYTPTAEETALALRCCEALGLGFAGVDLLHTANGEPLVCEVNASAHMAALTACTGVEVASCIIRYVQERESAR